MTFNAITLKMMRENYKQYLLYLGCNAFAILFLFLFHSIYFNPTIEQMKESHSFDTVLTIPAVALIIFMFFFIQYAHQMFIKKRKYEFGVLLAIGMTPRNIIRLLVTENLFIASISLATGLLFGGIFSKLFFYVFTYFSQLTPELYHLSFEMFGYTAFIYVVMFCMTIAISIFQISSQSSFTIMQSKQIIDKAKMTNGIFGLVGLVFIVISILGLLLTYRTQDQLLFVWAALTFFGLYLFLANLVHTIVYLIKRNEGLYYRFVLLFSSLEQKQKKLTSILTLTSIMIMTTTLYSTITIIIAKDEYENLLKENPSDIAFISENGDISEKQLGSILNKNNQKVEQLKVLPYLVLKQEDSYYKTVYYTNIIAQTDYERIAETKVNIPEDACIIFINQPSEYGHDKYNSCEILSNSYEVASIETNQLMTYISDSNVYIVVGNDIWKQLKPLLDLKYQYHIFLDDWEKSTLVVEQLKDLQREFQFEQSSFTSKIEQYIKMSEENSILFYLMIYLSVIFYVGAFMLLYLNLLADIDLEQDKFSKLYKIGITKKEIQQQFNVETAILFFIPTLIGLFLAFCYLIGMSQESDGFNLNMNVLYHFMMMSVVYFVIQLGFYIYVKNKLFKKVWRKG